MPKRIKALIPKTFNIKNQIIYLILNDSVFSTHTGFSVTKQKSHYIT